MNQYLKKYPYTKISFGLGARKEIEKLAPQLGNKALFATSRGFAKKQGFLDEVVSSFNKIGVSLQDFTGIEPEPSDTTVGNLAKVIKKYKPDFLIALGGGSVIDALKAASAVASLGMELKDLYGADMVSQALAKNKAQLRPLVAIPSTSGSGSEVTKYAMVFDAKDKLKKMITDMALVPKIALIDPEIMMTMPESLTVATGLDALTHLVEAYLSGLHAPDWLAPMTMDAIQIILQYLPIAREHPLLMEPREKMALASTCAGIAICYKGTGLPHGFSYAFRDVLPHGSVVALLLIPCWKYYLPAVEEKTRKLAPAFRVDPALPINDLAEAIFSELRKLYQKLGLPASLAEAPGVTNAVLRRSVENLSKNQVKLENAPRPVPPKQAQEILAQIIKSA